MKKNGDLIYHSERKGRKPTIARIHAGSRGKKFSTISRVIIISGIVAITLLPGCAATVTPTPHPTTIPTITPAVQPTTSLPVVTPTAPPDNLTEIYIINSSGQAISLRVEVAREGTDIFLHGLEERASLPENQGMLFQFEKDVMIPFQMWHTSLPLSIAFISSTMQILQIQDMQPFYPGTYEPCAPYRYALEVNQGFFAQNGIQVGDTVAFNP